MHNRTTMTMWFNLKVISLETNSVLEITQWVCFSGISLHVSRYSAVYAVAVATVEKYPTNDIQQNRFEFSYLYRVFRRFVVIIDIKFISISFSGEVNYVSACESPCINEMNFDRKINAQLSSEISNYLIRQHKAWLWNRALSYPCKHLQLHMITPISLPFVSCKLLNELRWKEDLMNFPEIMNFLNGYEAGNSHVSENIFLDLVRSSSIRDRLLFIYFIIDKL